MGDYNLIRCIRLYQVDSEKNDKIKEEDVKKEIIKPVNDTENLDKKE